jgi:DNA polymerase-3 subunit epsilon
MTNSGGKALQPTGMKVAQPDFVVVDVQTACSRVSGICQIGIVGGVRLHQVSVSLVLSSMI